jgi:hypothetical protein
MNFQKVSSCGVLIPWLYAECYSFIYSEMLQTYSIVLKISNFCKNSVSDFSALLSEMVCESQNEATHT